MNACEKPEKTLKILTIYSVMYVYFVHLNAFTVCNCDRRFVTRSKFRKNHQIKKQI